MWDNVMTILDTTQSKAVSKTQLSDIPIAVLYSLNLVLKEFWGGFFKPQDLGLLKVHWNSQKQKTKQTNLQRQLLLFFISYTTVIVLHLLNSHKFNSWGNSKQQQERLKDKASLYTFVWCLNRSKQQGSFCLSVPSQYRLAIPASH